jgi:catechol-2,3-dioxygenase
LIFELLIQQSSRHFNGFFGQVQSLALYQMETEGHVCHMHVDRSVADNAQ